jgi:hypothetical protein
VLRSGKPSVDSIASLGASRAEMSVLYPISVWSERAGNLGTPKASKRAFVNHTEALVTVKGVPSWPYSLQKN